VDEERAEVGVGPWVGERPTDERYDPVLLERKSILVLTKCDQLPGGVTGVDPELLKLHEPTVAISAVARQGLDQLLGKVAMVLRA